jgi:hypothetical protein
MHDTGNKGYFSLEEAKDAIDHTCHILKVKYPKRLTKQDFENIRLKVHPILKQPVIALFDFQIIFSLPELQDLLTDSVQLCAKKKRTNTI